MTRNKYKSNISFNWLEIPADFFWKNTKMSEFNRSYSEADIARLANSFFFSNLEPKKPGTPVAGLGSGSVESLQDMKAQNSAGANTVPGSEQNNARPVARPKVIDLID